MPTPRPPHHAPRPAGRFVETPTVRWARRLFAVLHRASPAAASRLSFWLLARPPRVAERAWQARLREQAQRSTLVVDGRRIALYSWGQGPTVLFVHGWGARATYLGKLVPPLVEAGYRVLAFDAPGHGHSSGRTATMPQFAEAIAAVAAQAGEVHTLVAHSFGVAMALWVVHDWGVQPQRLVLMSSLHHCQWITDEFARLMHLPLSIAERCRQLAVQRSGGRLDWARLDVGGMLARTDQPVLLLHDAHDPEIPIEHLHAVVAACGQRPVHWHVTEGLGHHRLTTHPDVVQRVLSFISAPNLVGAENASAQANAQTWRAVPGD